MACKIIPAKGRSGLEIDFMANRILENRYSQTLTQPMAFDIEAFYEFDLEDITGVKTAYGKLPHGIHGLTDSEKMISIVDADLMDDYDNQRFAHATIAHECGHAILHVREFRKKKQLLMSIQDSNPSLKLYRQENVPVYRNPEWQAFRFAGALLMPAATFEYAYRSGADIYELADIFQVNPAFVRSRLRALKLIN